MSSDTARDVTTLLAAIQRGEAGARDQLVALMYGELREMAARQMRRERPDHTLIPTALVHEVFIRFAEGQLLQKAPDRAYLYAAAARAMRQILAEHGRKRRRRPPGAEVDPEVVQIEFDDRLIDAFDLAEALEALAQTRPQDSDVVTLRFFGGLSLPEVADQLGLSLRTTERTWSYVRNWLQQCLAQDQ